MIVQLNTDNNITGSEKLKTQFNALIVNALDRYKRHISRVEVHLSDEDGRKSGQKDKSCSLEARLGNRKPIGVTARAETIEASVILALEKLKASVETILGKMKSH